MALSDQIKKFIKTVFLREQIPKEIPKGLHIPDWQIYSSYGSTDLAEMTKIEYDLLSRFADYEDMDDTPEISAALDLVADDATLPDIESGRTVSVEAEVGDIKDILTFLLDKTLKIDEVIWDMTRSLAKYGNEYNEVVVSDEGVVGINFLPPPTMRRIEKDRGYLVGFVQSFQSLGFSMTPEEFESRIKSGQIKGYKGTSPEVLFEPWEIVHMRFMSKFRKGMYGYSITESARWIWKRLLLLEDAMLVYRLTRSPSRFVIYVDVGDLPPAEAFKYVNKVKQYFKKKKVVEANTGMLSTRYNPLSSDEDFFIPIRAGREAARVDTLEGPSYTGLDDIEYFRNKLFAALKIPKSYLAREEGVTRSTLSQEDIRWARTILRVQREIRNGLKKISNIHLSALGIDPNSVNYDIVLNVPSAIFELAQLEVKRARAEFADSMEKWTSYYWIMSNIFGFSDEDIEFILKQREVEKGGGAVESLKQIKDKKTSIVSPEKKLLVEEDLFKGNKDHEKFIEDNWDRILKDNPALHKKILEIKELMDDLKINIKGIKN